MEDDVGRKEQLEHGKHRCQGGAGEEYKLRREYILLCRVAMKSKGVESKEAGGS